MKERKTNERKMERKKKEEKQACVSSPLTMNFFKPFPKFEPHFLINKWEVMALGFGRLNEMSKQCLNGFWHSEQSVTSFFSFLFSREEHFLHEDISSDQCWMWARLCTGDSVIIKVSFYHAKFRMERTGLVISIWRWNLSIFLHIPTLNIYNIIIY